MPEEILTSQTPETTEQAAPEASATPYNWRDDIHPDVKTDKMWESIPDVKTLTKVAADGQRYAMGAVKLPAPDADPAEWGKVYDKLGRPASPEGYTVGESLPNADIFQEMRGVAHSAGLTDKQFAALQSGYARIAETRTAEAERTARETTGQLKEEWGGAYDRKLGIAQRALRMGGEELWTKVGSSPLGNDPAFIRWVAQVGEALAEEGIVESHVEGVQDKASAQAELDTLTSSPAYLKVSDPGHKAAVERASKLFQLIYN